MKFCIGPTVFLFCIPLILVNCTIAELDCAQGDPSCSSFAQLVLLSSASAGAGAAELGFDCSDDGDIWIPSAAAEANSWGSVTFGAGLFVAISTTGANRVMTSPDGITWTPRAAAEANFWQSVTHGSGLFVAVSPDGANRVMTSPDGITWTPRAAAENNQ